MKGYFTLISFWWFKAELDVFNYSFHNCRQNPNVCVGIGQLLFYTVKHFYHLLAPLSGTPCAGRLVNW